MNAAAPNKTTLFTMWIIVMALLGVTWSLARLNLGEWNLVAAMTIAVTQMFISVLYFMHIRYRSRLTWVFAAGGLFWLFIMIALVMGDYLTRARLSYHP